MGYKNETFSTVCNLVPKIPNLLLGSAGDQPTINLLQGLTLIINNFKASLIFKYPFSRRLHEYSSEGGGLCLLTKEPDLA